MAKCDDGEYSLQELADIIGITVKLLINRACEVGWDSPKIFQPKKARYAGYQTDANNPGNAEWQALGKTERKHNLKKIVMRDYDNQASWKTCIDPRY